MKRKRALVDVDGVLADFLTPALAIVKQVSGKTFVPTDFHSWDIWDTIPKQYKEACHKRFCEPGFCASANVAIGAQKGLLELAEHMDVYIVTSPYTSSPTWVHERSEWLANHFDIPFKRIIHTSAKYTVSGDLFIDDNPGHVEKWAEHNSTGMPVLWDQPYNQQPLRMQRPWIRAKDWDHILGHVHRLGLPQEAVKKYGGEFGGELQE